MQGWVNVYELQKLLKAIRTQEKCAWKISSKHV